MVSIGGIVLGLGFFFLGMQLVGDHMRRLSSTGFRSALRASTHSPLLSSLVGVLFGALMQSATAVTFILVSMVRSGLLSGAGALPVLIWCNVGLTALAFLLALKIHPLVAFLVGVSGVAFGMIRNPSIRSYAGVLLGVGLILLGLESMSGAAEAWKESGWLSEFLHEAGRAPWAAFLAGIALAALLQSNTGATLLIISLAANGVMSPTVGAALIYGTNLGAIFLRWFLALGMPREDRRLVRFEDFLVLFGGIMMFGLLLLELAGVPLVLALTAKLFPGLDLRLAVVFLLSNLLPALVIFPFRKTVWQILCKRMPESPEAKEGRPKYLNDLALEDPSTAMDLLLREISRLLAHLRLSAVSNGRTHGESPAEEFVSLSDAIDDFSERLTLKRGLSPKQIRLLHLARSELSLVRHLEEAVRSASSAWSKLNSSNGVATALESPLSRVRLILGSTAVAASRDLRKEEIEQLLIQTADLRESLREVRHGEMLASMPKELRFSVMSFSEDLDVVLWLLHRLGKLLRRIAGLDPVDSDGDSSHTAFSG